MPRHRTIQSIQFGKNLLIFASRWTPRNIPSSLSRPRGRHRHPGGPPAHPGHRPAPNGLRPRKRHHLLPKRKLPPQADLRGNGVHCAVLSVLLGATRIASEEERRLRLSAECAFMIPSRRALSIKMPVSINKRLSL